MQELKVAEKQTKTTKISSFMIFPGLRALRSLNKVTLTQYFYRPLFASK